MIKQDSFKESLTYRPEIDGLRALAVLSVVFYHADYSLFAGGYVGVDVFLVISGFLITSVLLTDIEREDFSFFSFYARRARRLLPALFLVLLATMPLAYFVLLPSHLAEYAASLLAVLTFSSNIFFFRNIGYFEIAAEVKPLLHTWSLSLEEQFYFILPVGLFIVFKVHKKLIIPVILMIITFSLIVSELGATNAPVANFFLLPSRIWEFLIGSLVATLPIDIKNRSRRRIGYFGLISIFVSVLAFDEATPFPSLYAMLPVFGTAMILLGDCEGGFVALLLKSKMLTRVGLMSYSIYLWHQPIFSFTYLLLPNNYDYLRPFLILTTITFSYFSWRYIERPFRDHSLVRNRVFGCALGSVTLLCSVFAISGILSNGFPSRYGSPTRSFETGDQYLATVESKSIHCEPQSIYLMQSSAKGITRCHQSRSGTPDLVIFGDSHAEHLFPGLRDSTQRNVVYYIDGLPDLASDLYEAALQYLEETKAAKTFIVSARYLTAFESEADTEDFFEFIRELESGDAHVYLIGDVPKFSFEPEACVYASAREIDQFCKIKFNEWSAQKNVFEPVLQSLASELANTSYISLEALFCSNEFCSAISPSHELLFRDRDHLNSSGSYLVGQYLAQQVSGL